MKEAARSRGRGLAAPAAILGVVAVGAIALAGALWIVLAPVRGTPPVAASLVRSPGARAAPLEIAPDPIGSPERRAVELAVPEAAASARPVPGDAGAADRRAEAAVLSLEAAIDPETFSTRIFERQARVLATGLRADAGAAGVQALERIAGDGARGDRDAVAAAVLLRELRTADAALPGSALAALRRTWQGREEDPTLALAAVGALGMFGDLEDRRAMLDGVAAGGRAIDASLALAGLGAARGDFAVLEMVEALDTVRDPRRREIAVCALTQIVALPDHGLSASGRERCAEFLRNELRTCRGRCESTPRIVSALAALDPEAAAKRLLALLADPAATEGTAQGVASRLASMPGARADLRALSLDRGIPEARRVLALEALARAERKISTEGRALLEDLRDREPATPLGRRAGRILARAENGMAGGVGEEPDG